MKLTLTHEWELTDQDIRDLIITAVEGGIGYWSMVDDYNQNLDEHSAVTLFPYVEPDDFYPQTILPQGIVKGVEQYCIEHHVTPDALFGDYGDYDAVVADCVVQYALFGELVFG